jgi:hypothetical protein
MDSIGESNSVANGKEGWSNRLAEFSETTNSIDQKIERQSPDCRFPSKERPTAESEHFASSVSIDFENFDSSVRFLG